jgi:DNA-binding MarR family transcriptional regulator
MDDDQLRLDRQICFPLYAASNILTRLYRPLLSELGLTYSQYLVMLSLWENSPQTVSGLGQSLYLDTGTLTPLLKRLEQHGLIVRRRAVEDERRVCVEPTREGMALKERARRVPEAMVCRIAMSEEEVASLRGHLQRFVAVLSEVDPRNTNGHQGNTE